MYLGRSNILVAILISLIIAISGCTMPQFFPSEKPETTPAGTQGLRIESFGPDVEFPIPNQDVYIEVVVKNVGDAVATDIKGTPYLLAWEDYKGEKSCATNLNPPNPEINREGEECSIKWKVTTPSDIKEPQTYNAGVSISYKYETKTLITVYALSETEYVKKREAGEQIPTVKSIVNSDAPIHVEARMQDVLKLGGDKEIPITLIFKNVGNGNVKYENYRYKLDDVSAEVKGLGITLDDSDCDEVFMRGGKEGSCQVTLDLSAYGPPTYNELKIPIEVTTKYTYTITTETKITVHPTLE
jgi:hypothetical protein